MEHTINLWITSQIQLRTEVSIYAIFFLIRTEYLFKNHVKSFASLLTNLQSYEHNISHVNCFNSISEMKISCVKYLFRMPTFHMWNFEPVHFTCENVPIPYVFHMWNGMWNFRREREGKEIKMDGRFRPVPHLIHRSYSWPIYMKFKTYIINRRSMYSR